MRRTKSYIGFVHSSTSCNILYPGYCITSFIIVPNVIIVYVYIASVSKISNRIVAAVTKVSKELNIEVRKDSMAVVARSTIELKKGWAFWGS